jgi:hypothetical protein
LTSIDVRLDPRLDMMTLIAATLVVSSLAAPITPFPEKIFGVWDPTETPRSILGPLAYDFIDSHDGGFSAQRDPTTGDVWFTVLDGQVFRVEGGQMQYCFGKFLPPTTSCKLIDNNNIQVLAGAIRPWPSRALSLSTRSPTQT